MTNKMTEILSQTPSSIQTTSEAEAAAAAPEASFIEELFDRDPLTLTRSDLAVMVRYYRDQRERFMKAEAEKASKPKRAKTGPAMTSAEAKALLDNINLDDL